MSDSVIPYSLKDAPALIERLLPVQKLSAEAFKEQMANQGKTLTAIGSYWKGRKPLILSKACVLGCLLPATENPARDLAIFEKLIGMDEESFVPRWKSRAKPKQILATLAIPRISDFFSVEPAGVLPESSPVDWTKPEIANIKVVWRTDITEVERRRLEVQLLPRTPYRDWVDQACRPEEVIDAIHIHIWDSVNEHLGTSAFSFPELVEQLGIMRYGHRPMVSDTFCGSGQIPFEAARLGCDVFASDLNPIACMLTWGAFNIVGGSNESRQRLASEQEHLIGAVQSFMDERQLETDGHGWQTKAFFYCFEVSCPESGWLVPLIPSLVISRGKRAIAELVPDEAAKRYRIQIRESVTPAELQAAQLGTIGRVGKYGEAFLSHTLVLLYPGFDLT